MEGPSDKDRPSFVSRSPYAILQRQNVKAFDLKISVAFGRITQRIVPGDHL